MPSDVRPVRHRRDRILPWASLIVAAAGIWQAGHWADKVYRINSERLMFGLWAAAVTPRAPHPDGPSEVPEDDRPRMLLPGLRFPPMSQPDAATTTAPLPEGFEPVSIPDLKRMTGYAEAVVYIWEWTIRAVAGWVGLAALLGWLSRRPRPFHLSAAIVILAGTVATLVGLHLLGDPHRGGLPPLPLQSYLLAGLIQSSYGWILLIAYARPRTQATVPVV